MTEYEAAKAVLQPEIHIEVNGDMVFSIGLYEMVLEKEKNAADAIENFASFYKEVREHFDAVIEEEVLRFCTQEKKTFN